MLGDLFEGCLDIEPGVQTVDALGQPPDTVPTCKGIIAFADAQDNCISMLTAANVRRTAAHRLYPEMTGQIDKRGGFGDLVRKIYYQCCFNDFATTLKYLQAARAVWPDTWSSAISLPRVWFVKIDMSTKWPNFALTEKPTTSASLKISGPFPTRKAAAKYIAALQTAFAICRRPDLIDSPQKAAACPYLQMATCPAPCVGNISPEQYRDQLKMAVAAASGRSGGYADHLRRQMLEVAENRQFEQAAFIKKRLEALDVLTARDYAWTHDLSEFAVLHIDRWAKIAQPARPKRKLQTFAGYLILKGAIHCLNPFTREQVEPFAAEVSEMLPSNGGQTHLAESVRSNLALFAYLRYRTRPSGIWLDCSWDGERFRPPNPQLITAEIDNLLNRKQAEDQA